MKRKILCLLGAAFMVLSLGACSPSNSSSTDSGNESSEPAKQTFTVAFEVDGVRYKTLKVKEGEKITDEVPDPTKDGFEFVGWYEGQTKVDLATYVVTKNVTFTAKFEERTTPQPGSDLSVDDVKEEGKTYYLVLGWWETTALNDDGTPKQTSYMTADTTRLFYSNMNKYLKATGSTDDEIKNISFRNYATEKVAEMGEKINADGDVDILVGVGNNINTTAGVKLYNEDNEYKFATPMGTKPENRYVALTSVASEKGLQVFNWLKETDAGKAAFLRELTDQEIEASLAPVEIDLTVTVHGDTDAVTRLQDKETAITMPTITIPEGKLFDGFATSQDGEVALKVARDATLKYDDVKALANGAKTLDLYPVFGEPTSETSILRVACWGRFMKEARFNSLVDAYKEYIKTVDIVCEGVFGTYYVGATSSDTYYKIAPFSEKVKEDGNVDVVLPVGSNWSTGQSNVPVISMEEIEVFGQTGRSVATANEDALTLTFVTFLKTDAAKAILTAEE